MKMLKIRGISVFGNDQYILGPPPSGVFLGHLPLGQRFTYMGKWFRAGIGW